MKLRLPRTLKARALWIACGLILLSHLLSLLIFEHIRKMAVVSTEARDLTDRIAGIVDLARSFPVEERDEILAAAQTRFLEMLPNAEELGVAACQNNDFFRELVALIDTEFEKMSGLDATVCVRNLRDTALNTRATGDGFDVLVWVNSSDGSETLFHATLPTIAPLFQDTVLLYLLTLVTCTMLLAWYLIRKATAPLQALATAADQFGVNIDTPMLPEHGPQEVASAAVAFNRMHFRLARMVKGQTEMLAAISHDLRSALTRVQLRAELLEDNQEKTAILRVLGDMGVMVESVLAYARGVRPEHKQQRIDITELVATLCQERQEEGVAVSCESGHRPRMLLCRPTSVRRAIYNLIDNAIKYGSTPVVTMHDEEHCCVIRVADDGPGIPEDKLESVLKPFYRLEVSRNLETGGVGLGLAIARDIARAHGGDIRIRNRKQGGFEADLILPTN